MLCCICKQEEAKVHITKCSFGEETQRVHLCEQCANRYRVNDPTGFSLADLLTALDQSATGNRNTLDSK